jgi:hypothetical protein
LALSRNKVAVRERAAGSPPFYFNWRQLIENSIDSLGMSQLF